MTPDRRFGFCAALLALMAPSVATAFQAPRSHVARRTGSLRVSFGSDAAAAPVVASDASALDWSFLDGVYLITCPNADVGGERLENTKRALEGIGISNGSDSPDLAVKEFDTDDENRIRGCYTSHISVLRDIAKEHDTKKVRANVLEQLFSSALGKKEDDDDDNYGRQKKFLVLEDNLAINGMGNMKQAAIDAMEKYANSGDHWDMIHLAYIPYVPDLVTTKLSKLRKGGTAPTDYDDNIVQLSCGVGSALGTTAYIINLPAIEKLLEKDRNGGFVAPIPDVMAQIFPETRYAINPTLLVRAPTTKSLVNPQLDDLRSFLFRPAVVSFTQRLLVATGQSTNVLLFSVVAALLATSAVSGSLTWHAVESIIATGRIDGPIFLPILSSVFTIFSLGIILQGALLAPKPPQESSSK